jgi:hypothetical protein
MNPKLRFQNGAGTEYPCLKCRWNPKSRNLTLRKIIPYLYGVLAVTTKNQPKLQENLKLIFHCTCVVRVFLEQKRTQCKGLQYNVAYICQGRKIFYCPCNQSPNNAVFFPWKSERM